jgi:hypothetical protein
MMGHEKVERILATYRDATPGERAAADTHVATCAQCAGAHASYDDVDALISSAHDPVLPSRLSGPLASLLERQGSGSLGFVFGRSVAPVAVVLFLLVALSVLVWSVGSGDAPVTLTPTLTTTLTPTSIIARETGAAALQLAAAQRRVPVPAVVPTPAPAPAPRVNPVALFAGSSGHATITH